MNRHLGNRSTGLVVILLPVLLMTTVTWAEEDPSAIEALKRVEAVLTRDESASGKPVIGVQLRGEEVPDPLFPRESPFYGKDNTDATVNALLKLRKLRWLDARSSCITNDVLSQFAKRGGWEHLEELDLSHNAVTDEIATSLGNLKSLTRIRLIGTRITAKGIADIAKQGRWTEIWWNGSVTKDVTKALASNGRLKRLVLMNCIFDVQAVAELSRLNRLEVLVLSRARVKEVKGNKHDELIEQWQRFHKELRDLLKSQQNLRALSLRNVTLPYGWLRDGLIDSPSITTLEAIDLVGHDNLDRPDLDLFAKMTKLKAASLEIKTARLISDNAATWKELGQLLHRIETLELVGRRGSFRDLKDVPYAKNLRHLRLWQVALKNAPEEVNRIWPNLQLIEIVGDLYVEKTTEETLKRAFSKLKIRKLSRFDEEPQELILGKLAAAKQSSK